MNEVQNTTATEVNRLHDEIRDHADTMIGKALRIGELLTEEKAALAHGEWIPWVQANLRFDVRQAQRYMRAHENRDRLNATSATHLTDAMRMLEEPKENGSSKPSSAPADPIASMFSWCPKVRASKVGVEILESLTPDEWAQLLQTASLLNEDTKACIVGDLLKYGVGEGGQKSIYTPGKYIVDVHCPGRWEEREIDVSIVTVDQINVIDAAYCRSGINWATVKRYSQTLAHLPPIELDSYNTLIDGRMRLEAYKAMKCDEIPVFRTDVENELPDMFQDPTEYTAKIKLLGAVRNAAHGMRPSEAEIEAAKSATESNE